MQTQLEDNRKQTTTYLLLLELGPVLLVVDHEALGSLWVTHLVVCGRNVGMCIGSGVLAMSVKSKMMD